MVTVPEAMPVTTPEELTDATDGALLLHVPPVGTADSVVDDPMHKVLLPVMAALPFTVTVRTTEQPPESV